MQQGATPLLFCAVAMRLLPTSRPNLCDPARRPAGSSLSEGANGSLPIGKTATPSPRIRPPQAFFMPDVHSLIRAAWTCYQAWTLATLAPARDALRNCTTPRMRVIPAAAERLSRSQGKECTYSRTRQSAPRRATRCVPPQPKTALASSEHPGR